MEEGLHSTPPIDETTERGRGLSEPTLLDPVRIRQDARLIERAIRHRWTIEDAKRPGIVDRLIGIVAKTEVGVMSKHGIVQLDGPADQNAIAAARCLVAMDALNQADERPVAGATQVNVGVAVNGVTAKEVAAELILNGDWRRIEVEPEPTCLTPSNES